MPGRGTLKLSLLDASLAEVSQDLAGLAHLLDDQQWTAIVMLFPFGITPEDLDILLGLARVCAAHSCACLAGAHPRFVNCDSFALHPDLQDWRCQPPADYVTAWNRLRGAPAAVHVQLALPRFLLRQPYGTNSDPIKSFAFEEMLDPVEHESYLWGNSAVFNLRPTSSIY